MDEVPSFCGFLHDGYTRPGYIEARARLHPALRFHYRPLLAQERGVIFRQIATLGPAEAERLAAQAVQAQLVDWDLDDQGGRRVEITAANLLRVEPNLALRLFEIVSGRGISDEDPHWNPRAQEDHAAQLLERVLAGRTAEDEEEAAVGNCGAGCGCC